MNREQREQAWIDLGLLGAFEMMHASCMMAERLADEHLNSPALMRGLMKSIANEIIGGR